jgi:hypothetical protein
MPDGWQASGDRLSMAERFRATRTGWGRIEDDLRDEKGLNKLDYQWDLLFYIHVVLKSNNEISS